MQQLLRLLESQEYQHGCYKKNHFHSKDEVTGLKFILNAQKLNFDTIFKPK